MHVKRLLRHVMMHVQLAWDECSAADTSMRHRAAGHTRL